ncbi:MAG: MBG domain-containing protein [Candidatus Acidiferrales bacterium]
MRWHKNRFFLAFALAFIALSHAQATSGQTITAASCSESDVLAALSSAVSGDTVVIPAGTCTWTTPEYYTAPANLTIQGQTVCTGSGAPSQNDLSCADNTVIVDGTNHGSDDDQPMWQITTNAAGAFRITGITFGWGGGQVTDNGTLQFIGGSQQFRMDHVHFSLITRIAFIVSQQIAGVIDHIIIDGIAPGSGFRTNGGTATDLDGHTNWAAPTALGTGSFVYIENSIFNNASNDCFQGGRWVVRYNTFNNGATQTHATGLSLGSRGCRAWELYENQFLSSSDSCTVTASFNGSPSHSALLITEIGGVAATNPLDAHSAMNQDQPTLAANDITSGTSTTSHNGDYIWGATVSPNASYGTVSAGTGFTVSQPLASGETMGEYRIQPTAGPVSATFTDLADLYLHVQTFMMDFASAGGSSQPAFVQGTTGLGFNANSVSATFSNNLTNGDMIAVVASAEGAEATNVTSSCSGSFTQVDTVDNGVLNATSSDWYALANYNGAATLPPPSVPTGLMVTGTTTSTVSLSWTASTGSNGVAGYEIFRGADPIATTAGTSYTDSGLTPNTTYTYTVSAYGSSGNTSNQSATASATTLATPSAIPPTVSISSPMNNATLSGTVTVTASASDTTGVTQVQLYLDGTTLLATFTATPYTYSWNTTSVTNAMHTLTAEATDGVGNNGSSAAVGVTVNNTGGATGSSPNSAQPVFFLSSGTGVVWGNNASGGSYSNFVTIHSLRRDDGGGQHPEVATPNGWGYCGTSFDGTGSNWDQKSNTVTGYRCLDQPGQGQGDLLSGDVTTGNLTNTVTGCTASASCAWPQEALEPVYEWMDSFSGSQPFWENYETDALINNSDYYLWCNALSPSGCASYNGTAGVGSGPLSARPATCTPGVGYWATDQGNWNQSGSGGQGELFVCGPTVNTWALHYEPYTYPHPLDTSGGSGGTTAQTITFNPLSPVTYGVAPITLTATASSGLPVSYTFTGPATLSGSTLTITGAGSVTVTASQAGNATYAAATPVQRILTVNKALLTVTANNAGMVYGQSLPSFTYTITGFVNGDTSAVVSGTAAETTTATSASPVGTYPITFSTESLAAANYTFTYVNGTLTISSATPPPAFVQGTSTLGFNTNSDSATFTSNVTSGDMIAVMASAQGAGITNVTSSCSGSFTQVDAVNSTALNATSADWYALATSTGSCTVTASLSGPAGHSALFITEISGVAATNPLDAHSAMNQDQPALAANAITSGTSTTVHSGDYIWGATVSPNDSYGAVSAGTGFTLSQALKGGETLGEYEIQSAAGPISATFTDTADHYLHIQTFMMAFAP